MRACVVLPTINEVGNIRVLLPVLKQLLNDSVIVVIDDGSIDGTPQVAEALGALVIERRRRLGLSSAIDVGLRQCISLGAGVGVVMDADLQHPPEAVPGLVNACVDHDICISVRVSRDSLPIHRRLISLGAEAMAKLVLGDGVTGDFMSGFFSINLITMRDYVLAFKPIPRNYKYLMEFLAFLRRVGVRARIIDVPYRQWPRAIGRSKMGIIELLMYAVAVARWAFPLLPTGHALIVNEEGRVNNGLNERAAGAE